MYEETLQRTPVRMPGVDGVAMSIGLQKKDTKTVSSHRTPKMGSHTEGSTLPLAHMSANMLNLGPLLSLACILEASVAKPGNVHPAAEFADMTFADMVASGLAVGRAWDQLQSSIGPTWRVGQFVRMGVRATRASVGKNTNLGMLLLLGPLARAADHRPLCQAQVGRVLDALTQDDSTDIFASICDAAPGGLGQADRHDVHGAAPVDVRTAMCEAADRDLIARQYCGSFEEVFGAALPWLVEECERSTALSTVLIRLHLRLMQAYPDSLIARKCGLEMAAESARRAGQALAEWDAQGTAGKSTLELDAWLRSDGHRRNPGTTADLVAATLFVKLYNDEVRQPTAE
ncbi:MAG: triphosphoribosyl-dephospho-CoA synthase [Planctomycetales bacterium]|nr:triphosphoribosyl-dephospho-CoA synthase [Planctomycetales bacterium]